MLHKKFIIYKLRISLWVQSANLSISKCRYSKLALKIRKNLIFCDWNALFSRTNAPIYTMEYPDFPYPNNTVSYPPQANVLEFLHSYVDKFDLKRHIKFSHLVLRVLPIENNKWEVIVRNLLNKTVEIRIFDAVFVCNGHYSTTVIPEIPGAREFKGKVMHSHDFRTAEAFRGNIWSFVDIQVFFIVLDLVQSWITTIHGRNHWIITSVEKNKRQFEY